MAKSANQRAFEKAYDAGDDEMATHFAELVKAENAEPSHEDIVNQINPEPARPPMKVNRASDKYKKPRGQEGFQISEMVQNIPGSALQLVEDVATPFAHPD